MAYATPAQMLARYDKRRVEKLVTDTGVPATDVAILTDANLLACLDDASGMIDASLLRGGKYLPADLAALTGTGAAYLTRICCDLCYGLLVMRRGFAEGEIAGQCPGWKLAQEALALLSRGENVLNIQDNINASKPVRVVLDARKTLSTVVAGRHFGTLNTDPQTNGPKGYQ